uniref:Protein phosphatase inhibitor 2 n=1 Tax=Nyssomyia neivai TaxID=330878 RepID=A0A1L8DKP7_9DIPT
MSCNSSGESEPKKPCKGILKTSSSFDKHSVAMHRKSAKFDELNVLQTYHPPDKDYGHMKIEEPKTPYNYMDNSVSLDELDAEVLAEKLKAASARTSSFSSEDDSEEEVEPETEEQKAKRLDFESRRKAHYKEFEAVKLARKLIEEEEDDEDEVCSGGGDNKVRDQKMDPDAGGSSTSTASSLKGTTIP